MRWHNHRVEVVSGGVLLFFSVFLAGFSLAANGKVYYDPTIKSIIARKCARCHSGPARNLMDYDSLKMYADSGMLVTMVQGPMAGFAGNDRQTIIDWANAGAPEKPGPAKVNFFNRPHGMGRGGGRNRTQPYVPDVSMDKVTYTNTIQYVLAKDCLRCHSDKFRNLTTYENVNIYVKNGLLKMMVERGGPMRRFACGDAELIISWINNGAPK